MCYPVIAHWIYMVNHGVEHDSMHRPCFSQGWTRLQHVQAVGQAMRPIEMEITSVRAMDFVNAFMGNSMRESMIHYFHLRTFPIDSPIPLKEHGDSMR